MLDTTSVLLFLWTLLTIVIEYVRGGESIPCWYLTCQSPQQYCHKPLRTCASCKDFCDFQEESYCKFRCPEYYNITYGNGQVTTTTTTTTPTTTTTEQADIRESEHIKKPAIPGFFKEDVPDSLDDKDYNDGFLNDGVVDSVSEEEGGENSLSRILVVCTAVAALIVITTLLLLSVILVYKRKQNNESEAPQTRRNSRDPTTSPMLPPGPQSHYQIHNSLQDPLTDVALLDIGAQKAIFQRHPSSSSAGNIPGRTSEFYKFDLPGHTYIPASIVPGASSSYPEILVHQSQHLSPQTRTHAPVHNTNNRLQDVEHVLELVPSPASSTQIGAGYNRGGYQDIDPDVERQRRTSVISSSSPQIQGASAQVHNTDGQYQGASAHVRDNERLQPGASAHVQNMDRQHQSASAQVRNNERLVTVHKLYHPVEENYQTF